MKYLLPLLLVACVSEPRPKPDAGVEIDAEQPLVWMDAPPDAAPDAVTCWMYRQFQCGAVIYNLCVPYDGCSESFECNGQMMAYCGPG